MSPSHELLIRTEPSSVASLPTRIVEQAEVSRHGQVGDPTTEERRRICANLLVLEFITSFLRNIIKGRQHILGIQPLTYHRIP
jgi:hypothetical protein